MIPIWHFIASLVLFFALYPYLGLASLIVFFTGWLIDFDHALYYIFKYKDFNWNKMYSYFKDKKFKKKVINIFHTAEVYAVIASLSFYNIYALIATIGLFVHVLMDLIYFLAIKRYDLRYWTLTGWIIDVLRQKRKE